MAQETDITAREKALSVGLTNELKLYKRTINFATNNLTNGNYFQVFTLAAGSQVLGGVFQVNTLDAGGGTLSLGVGGTGTELLSAQALSAATAAKLTAGGVQLTTTSDTIDISAGTADITTAVVTIYMLVLEPTGQVSD